MYAREQGRLIVKWNPDDLELAEQAMQNVVDDTFEWVDERNRRDVDDATARQVREEYARLVEENGGSA